MFRFSIRDISWLAVVLIASASDSTLAQNEEVRLKGVGGSGPDHNLVLLATNEAVQRELGVSGSVADTLTSLRRELIARLQQEHDAVPIVFPISSEELSQRTIEIWGKLNPEFNRRVQEALSSIQLKRLKQIQIQAQRFIALTNPDVVADLKLTDDQIRKLTDLQRDYQPSLRALRYRSSKSVDPFTPFTQQKWAAKIRELNANFNDSSLFVLTAEQQRQFASLSGPPFDVDQLNTAKGKRRDK